MTDESPTLNATDGGTASDGSAGQAVTDGGTASDATDAERPGDAGTIKQAVREIRREGYKAAALHATVDAVAVLLLCYLVFARTTDLALPTIEIPSVGPVDGALLVAGVGALVTFGTEFTLRTRWYTLERFEAANPVVADALRTAREAADTGRTSVMARRLYRDVTARLSETDGTVFVHTRWLAVSVVLVVLLSGATLGTAVAGVQFSLGGENATAPGGASGGGAAGGGSGTGAQQAEDSEGDDELQDGEEVLGDLKDVSSGNESVRANVSAGQGSGGEDRSRQIYDEGAGSPDSEIAARRAGFQDDRNLEDADLVRDYNLRLQARDDDDN